MFFFALFCLAEDLAQFLRFFMIHAVFMKQHTGRFFILQNKRWPTKKQSMMSQKMVIRMLGSKSESEVAKNAGRIGYVVVLFYYGRFYSASLTKKTETL